MHRSIHRDGRMLIVRLSAHIEATLHTFLHIWLSVQLNWIYFPDVVVQTGGRDKLKSQRETREDVQNTNPFDPHFLQVNGGRFTDIILWVSLITFWFIFHINLHLRSKLNLSFFSFSFVFCALCLFTTISAQWRLFLLRMLKCCRSYCHCVQ